MRMSISTRSGQRIEARWMASSQEPAVSSTTYPRSRRVVWMSRATMASSSTTRMLAGRPLGIGPPPRPEGHPEAGPPLAAQLHLGADLGGEDGDQVQPQRVGLAQGNAR